MTVPELLAARAGAHPDAVALAAPGREPLTYGRLSKLTAGVAGALCSLGLPRGAPVALVLPNGPEMAAAFLAVACRAAAAPLNPSYRAAEYEFYLEDLAVGALVVQRGVDSPAVEVAGRLGIPVVELAPETEAAAGTFTLSGLVSREVPAAEAPRPEDAALILHTSGTTSRPKMVPLSQRNICASARNVRDSLALTPEDRCLNMMPLFHIHGLIAALMASVEAGGSVVCTPGFDPHMFFTWLDECTPTWYSAVPTMHQAILAGAPDHEEVVRRRPLRFIRSSSAALAPSVMGALETHFSTAVVEAYGMTEAAHQMASNPLPPLPRKPGSVGLPAGPEVAIMNEAGELLPAGETGEIVIRGENVTRGYASNPEANEQAFTDGWFRTGDEGRFDEDGYLIISGRLKEIINRGGEKISPREVDEVLLTHPAVRQVVTFAMPDVELGEEVAAAVVLEEGSDATERDLTAHAGRSLAYFKVPRRIVFLDEIPKGPTGKLRRIGLAETLGLTGEDGGAAEPAATRRRDDRGYVAPRNHAEEAIAAAFRNLLRVDRVGAEDAFLDMGGTSLLAVRLFDEMERIFGKRRPIATLLTEQTVAALAKVFEDDRDPGLWSPLVAIRTGGTRLPFFCVHTLDGEVISYAELSRGLDPEQSFYGIRARGLDGTLPPFSRLPEMAAAYVAEIRTIQRNGPFLLGGMCFGGMVAYEMGRQLAAEGQEVGLLAMFDAPVPPFGFRHLAYLRYERWIRGVRGRLAGFARRRGLPDPSEVEIAGWPGWAARAVRAFVAKPRGEASDGSPGPALPSSSRGGDVYAAHIRARQGFHPAPAPLRVSLFLAKRPLWNRQPDGRLGWIGLAREGTEVHELPGGHHDLLRRPVVGILAAKLDDCLRRAQPPERSG